MFTMIYYSLIGLVGAAGVLLALQENLWGAALIGLAGIVLAYSFEIINGTEVAALEDFGDPVGWRGPGLVPTPPWRKVHRYPRGEQQNELPAEPEKVFDGEGKIPEGMFPPNRIKFGQPIKAGEPGYDPRLEGDPYDVAMVTEVPTVLVWEIEDATLFRKSFGTVERFFKIANDKMLEMFGDAFATMTPARALLDLSATNAKVENDLREELKGKGAKIIDAYAKPFKFGHGLNKAVVAVKEAKLKGEAAALEAAGMAEAARNEAKGKRDALLATGLAQLVNPANPDGPIELLPDAATRTNADAVKELKELKGTIVFGGGINPSIDVTRRGGN